MHRSLFVLICFCALLAERAFPIGRTGNNSIGDRVDGYAATVPTEFHNTSAVGDGGMLLQSGLFMSSPPQPVDINILSFRSQFPELVGKGKTEIEKFFASSTDTKYFTLPLSNSALNLFGEGASSLVGIAVCGDGRGYVIFAPKVDITDTAMKKLMRDTVFERPCTN